MKKIITSFCIILAAASAAKAQEFGTTYFLDNNLYSYRINPAIPGEKGFVGFVLSNINGSVGTNVGVKSLLYPNGTGGLVTGFHNSISASQFLQNIPKTISTEQLFNENLLAIGFWTKNAFHNIEINVKEDVYLGLPGEMLEMFKCGSSDTPYDLGTTRVAAKSYAEVAYGYTRKVGEKFSVGGRLKLLVGLMAGNVGFDKAFVNINGNNVSYDLDARMRLSSNLIGIGTTSDDIFDFSSFNLALQDISPSGLGGALDLGMTYKPYKNLTISFSVLDLGGISWKYNIAGRATGGDKFTGETIKSDGTLSGDLEKFAESFSELAKFKSISGGETSFDMLACTMHLGARYYMPFYDRLSAGLLATYRIDRYNPLIGIRLGATVTPVDWLSITGNYGINSYCKSFGLAMSLNAANFNFVLGYEGYSGATSRMKINEFSSIVTPIGPAQNTVKLGINITFGKRHNNFGAISSSFINGKKAE